MGVFRQTSGGGTAGNSSVRRRHPSETLEGVSERIQSNSRRWRLREELSQWLQHSTCRPRLSSGFGRLLKQEEYLRARLVRKLGVSSRSAPEEDSG